MKKKLLMIFLAWAVTLMFMAYPAMAKQYLLCDMPVNITGYVSQFVNYNYNGDAHGYEFTNEKDVNSALFNFFIEGDIALTDDLKFYTGAMLTMDLIYEFKHDDYSWNDKEFDKSRRNLFIDDEYWQLLKEAHFTWTPGNWYFRAGKQLVLWGEMLGVRVTDVINPLDMRRGPSDVEFETTIIPIWLLRTEYYLKKKPAWVQDLGLELIFNPNADFIPDAINPPGTDASGIWAPDVRFYVFPYGTLRIGSPVYNGIEEPDDWDKEGMEGGVRLKGLIKDAMVTLNYFYGKDNTPIIAQRDQNGNLRSPLVEGWELPGGPRKDGVSVCRPFFSGYYPRVQMIGATFARDIERLRPTFLGGVAPLFRLEGAYFFKRAYNAVVVPGMSEYLVKRPEIRYAISADIRLKINWLNPKHYITLGPQFYHRKILDYPHTGPDPWGGKAPVRLSEAYGNYIENDDYTAALVIMTEYAHSKIKPRLIMLRNFTWEFWMYRWDLTYARSHNWNYSLGAIIMQGSEFGALNVFENKDYIFFKITYKFG